jgi:hypothetical protein
VGAGRGLLQAQQLLLLPHRLRQRVHPSSAQPQQVQAAVHSLTKGTVARDFLASVFFSSMCGPDIDFFRVHDDIRKNTCISRVRHSGDAASALFETTICRHWRC